MGRRSLAVVVAVSALALVVATPVGPVELSYVTSGSMEPTLQPGDGYVVHRTTDVVPGDVVTFRSAGSDEYVTHRVVGVTDRGYVTKGDANPSTDQRGGHPYVTDEDVVGKVVTVGGSPLVVPHLRAVATGVDRHRVPLAGLVSLLVLLVLADTGRTDRFDRTRRAVSRGRVVRTLLAVAVLASVGVLLMTVTAETLTFVAVDDADASDEFSTPSNGSYTRGTVVVGESATRNVSYVVSDVPTVDYLVRADGATVVGRSEPDENGTVQLTLAVPPQERAGPHEVRVRFVRYPSPVPRSLVAWVADRSVTAVVVLSVVAAYLPPYLVYRSTVDPRVPVRLPRSRTVRRWLR